MRLKNSKELNNISEEDLKQEKLLEGMSWKSHLKNLDTPAKIEEFINKMKQITAKIKLAKQNTPNDTNPKNKWVAPLIILSISFLALTTSLILIIRRRKQRRF